MRITVIMPAYRAERFIRDAVDSLLAQTFSTWNALDLIVVCDGCRETFAKLGKYKGKIKAALLRDNVGTYRAINAGLSLANPRSQIIGTMGADDMVAPMYLERIADMYDPTELSAYSTFYEEVDLNGQHIRFVNRHAPTGQFFYDSRVFKKLGGFRPWHCAADTEFWQRALVEGVTLKTHRDPFFKYRRHGGQITASKERGFGTEYRNEKAELVKRVKYDHSLAGFVEPECGEIIKQL